MAKTKRAYFFLLLGLAGVFSAVLFIFFPSKQSRAPNFVFILVDDLGYMDIGANNPNTFYDTPNINRLAAQGMRFTNAYDAAPVCSPARASIVTGKYPARLGITDYIHPKAKNQPDKWKQNTRLLPAKFLDHLVHEEVTLAEAMKDAGYVTFFAGKWHLGPEEFWPEDHGFDINKGGGPYGGRKYFSPYDNPRLEDGPEGEHLPDRLATETLQFIKDNHDKRFFAFLSFYSVHTPLIARKDLEKKYLLKRQKGPADSWGQEGNSKVRLVQNNAVYAGMVEAMDLAVGKVLDTLSKLALDESTIVIFMSDNGGFSTSHRRPSPTSNLPLRAGKGWLYEGGIRVATIIKWAGGIKPGSVSSEPVTSTDYYPTILEMAGLAPKPKQHTDGVSLVPLLQGEKAIQRDAVYWHYPHYGNQGGSPGAAVRAGDWKLIEFFEDNHVELYNLRSDIGEKKDLSQSMPGKVSELTVMLHAWQKEMNARFPEPNPVFNQ